MAISNYKYIPYIFTLLATDVLSQDLTAGQKEKIKIGLEAMKLSCGTSSTREKIETEGNGGVSITLKKLPGAEVGGQLKYSKDEAIGLAGAINKELNENSLNLSKEQLACTREMGKRIFDLLFPEAQRPPARSETRPQISRDFVLSEGATEVMGENDHAFTLIRVIQRADTTLVQVRVDGREHQMASGMSLYLDKSSLCRITLLEPLKKNNALFRSKC